MSLDLKVRITGFDELKRNLNELVPDIDKALARALMREGEEIAGDAKERTPVDTGRLRASGYAKMEGDKAVEVGFDTEYAIYVHENLSAHHTVGEAKFLERTMLEHQSGMLERLEHSVAQEAGLV